jgi:hypothetical protein
MIYRGLLKVVIGQSLAKAWPKPGQSLAKALNFYLEITEY